MRWLKYCDVIGGGGLVYEYTDRPMDAGDRDGSDVRDHYHAHAVAQAEAGLRDLPPLRRHDTSFRAAVADFHSE